MTICYKTIFLGYFVLQSSSAFLLNTEISRESIFVAEKEMTLLNHVIASHDVTSALDCGFLCTSRDNCQTYNYKPSKTGNKNLCQLNNATKKSSPAAYKAHAGFVHYFRLTETFKSCLDYLRNGVTTNGIYPITDSKGDTYKVFCDLSSEPHSAWTLILSFAFKNRHKHEFCTHQFSVNSPLKENDPNWDEYRLTLHRMERLSAESSHVRVTTSYPEYGVDFRDYFRAKTSHLDILSYRGAGKCKKMEVFNVRGYKVFDKTIPFWQPDGEFLHSDTTTNICNFSTIKGSTPSENNFGRYCQGVPNPAFRGCEKSSSTTNYWFGGYI